MEQTVKLKKLTKAVIILASIYLSILSLRLLISFLPDFFTGLGDILNWFLFLVLNFLLFVSLVVLMSIIVNQTPKERRYNSRTSLLVLVIVLPVARFWLFLFEIFTVIAVLNSSDFKHILVFFTVVITALYLVVLISLILIIVFAHKLFTAFRDDIVSNNFNKWNIQRQI